MSHKPGIKGQNEKGLYSRLQVSQHVKIQWGEIGTLGGQSTGPRRRIQLPVQPLSYADAVYPVVPDLRAPVE